MERYIQYVYHGNGFFLNVEKLDSYEEIDIVKRIRELRSTINGIVIIGYRLFEKDNKSDIKNMTGIHYITGEEFEYPKITKQMLTYISNLKEKYENGQRIIVVMGEYPIVYKLSDEDVLIEYDEILSKIIVEEHKQEIDRLIETKSKLRKEVANELRRIADDIDSGVFDDLIEVDDNYAVYLKSDVENLLTTEEKLVELLSKLKPLESLE